MSTHIGAAPGEIADTVLMPGDPYRAKWAAETFLEDAACINEVRGMLGFTGTWKGNRVTIHGSGMGMPSLSIYANELIRDYGARTLIRIGSAGAMQDGVKLRDVVIAMTSSTLSMPSQGVFREMRFAPCADYGLLERAVAAARAMGTRFHVGGIHSSDAFYDDHRLLEKHEFGPGGHVEQRCDFEQQGQHARHGNLIGRARMDRLSDRANGLRELRYPVNPGHVAGVEVNDRDALIISRDEAEQDFGQELSLGRIQAAHDPEVDGDDAAIAVDEQISLVHVGMEESVAHCVSQESLDDVSSQRRQVESGRAQPVVI